MSANSPVPPAATPPSPLGHLGVILATGPDAASFLQGQLTQDTLLMSEGESRLAAYCTAKGRMTASFWLHKQSTTEFLLVCRRDILAATLKRLSMFVLRAKVKLSDASGQLQLAGLAGESMEAIKNIAVCADSAGVNTPNDPPAAAPALIPLAVVDGQARAIQVCPGPNPGEAATAWWQWSEVASGIAMISPAVVEAFVPQMLNYESVGGVNFKKGCYPGQEVVARSQFRGTLKRRAYLVRGDAAMAPGDEIFSASDPSQPCGLVAQAATVPGTAGYLAIVSMQVAAAQAATDAAGGLTLKSPDGPGLVLQPLPYALLDDI